MVRKIMIGCCDGIVVHCVWYVVNIENSMWVLAKDKGRSFLLARSWCVIFFLFVFVVPVCAQEGDSLSVLQNMVVQSPKDGDAWVRLGYAYLAVDSLGAAERAFQKGERYAKSARGYVGQGLVRVQKGVRYARSAFPFFRKALGVDPTLIEAQLHIARTHKLLGDQDAEGAYRKVMEMDATYAPVYLELAQ